MDVLNENPSYVIPATINDVSKHQNDIYVSS